jgi:hypothetical protein
MQSSDVGFLIDDAGRRLASPSLFRNPNLPEKSDQIDYALLEQGFVLIKSAHRALFVELCPQKVAPLAALEASYAVKQTQAECVVLYLLGDTWRRQPYELLDSTKAASEKLKRIAGAANKRTLAKLRAQNPVPSLNSCFPWASSSGSTANLVA